MNDAKSHWFPAKRYGWGWGPPVTWQGWVVLVGWIAILVVVSPWLAPRSMPLFIVFEIVMVAVLLTICFLKGERPRWRWGRD